MLMAALAEIDPGMDLASAGKSEVHQHTEAIYHVLDYKPFQRRGVRATGLSKVLHRKRPRFLPLHDARVPQCYFGPNGVIPIDVDRSWAGYTAAFSWAVASDVRTQQPLSEVLDAASHFPGRLSHLRLLDIVAWKTASGATQQQSSPANRAGANA